MQPSSQWKSNKYYIFWVCLCILKYSLCNVRAPYCHLWSVRLYNIFPRYVIKVIIFLKKVTGHKMCGLIFYTAFVWNILHSTKNWARYDKNVHWYSYNVFVILVRFLMKLNIFRKIFEKNTQISEFLKLHPVGVELFHAGRQTDRQTWPS